MKEKYSISGEVEINELDNELIIVNPKTEKIYYCNKLSRMILLSIQEHKSISDIIDCLLSKYDVKHDTLQADVEDIIETMLHLNIIVPCP